MILSSAKKINETDVCSTKTCSDRSFTIFIHCVGVHRSIYGVYSWLMVAGNPVRSYPVVSLSVLNNGLFSMHEKSLHSTPSCIYHQLYTRNLSTSSP